MRQVTAILLMLISGFLLTGCGSEQETVPDQPRPTSANTTFPADSTGEITAEYKAVAEMVSGKFQRDLREALATAITEKGAAQSIAVCRLTAPELASLNDTTGWSVKRVTDKYRNKDNRADSSELVLLNRFKDSVDFEPYISFWSPRDSEWVFHFYEPIRTDEFCLNCHGDIQTLAGGVYDALKREYPDDHATGYKAGDIRGMFVVEGKWPGGKAYASHLSASETDEATE